MLNDREKKLLEHALSRANESEADNAATLFFRSLRKRSESRSFSLPRVSLPQTAAELLHRSRAHRTTECA